MPSGDELPESRLEVVQIYFDTASFDEIERDKKIKFEAQLSLIGGTMGLLTGFSIISGVEIICFLAKVLFSKLIDKLSQQQQELNWNSSISPTVGGCGLCGLRSSPPSQGQVQRGRAEVDLDYTRGT